MSKRRRVCIATFSLQTGLACCYLVLVDVLVSGPRLLGCKYLLTKEKERSGPIAESVTCP